MSISLIPRTLMSLLSLAYKEQDITTLEMLLFPYYMTYEQLCLVISDIHWSGSAFATSRHPSYEIVRRLSKYMQEDTHAKPDQIKRHFIYAAASICHAWYTRKDEYNRHVLHKNPQLVAYQEFDVPLPFVWISIDSHGMTHVFQRVRMPALQIKLYRSTKGGDLQPLYFFAHPEDEHAKEKACIEIVVYNQTLLNLQTEKTSNVGNFIILITESLTLSRCMLISPSTDRTWNVPLVLHLYE